VERVDGWGRRAEARLAGRFACGDRAFVEEVRLANFPGVLSELKWALQTTAIAGATAALTLEEHAFSVEGTSLLRADPFYRHSYEALAELVRPVPEVASKLPLGLLAHVGLAEVALGLDDREAGLDVDAPAAADLRFEDHLSEILLAEVQTAVKQQSPDVRLQFASAPPSRRARRRASSGRLTNADGMGGRRKARGRRSVVLNCSHPCRARTAARANPVRAWPS
jgi:hypothetical protein